MVKKANTTRRPPPGHPPGAFPKAAWVKAARLKSGAKSVRPPKSALPWVDFQLSRAIPGSSYQSHGDHPSDEELYQIYQ